jgi:hypothetical protein
MAPVTLPVTLGANVTDAEIACPAPIVRGVAMPPIPNSAPFKLIIETSKSPPPLLLIVRLLVTFDPSDTVPKSMAPELSANCGCVVPVTVPESWTADIPASPRTVSVPLAGPIFVPFIHTVRFVLCPAAIVAGNPRPDTLNCGFESAAS